MKASPLFLSMIVLVSASLARPVVAEYPIDPSYEADAAAPYGSQGYHDSYQYDEGYEPDPQLYESSYPQSGELFGNETPIWPGWISGVYQPGTKRSLFGGEWFQPLYQDGRNLWYFNFRGQGDDDSATEFNVGTGFRTLLDPGWIFGAYTYWDHLNSANGNSFNQGMIGVEAMNVVWDARFNVYFPESGGQSVGAPRARVSNGTLVVQSGLERAYWGLDAEVGNLLWAWGPSAQQELRGFVGIYHFDHSANATKSITGPRARLEYRWYDLPYFGPGSRLTAGITLQTDRVRDEQAFGFIQLRIPLDPWAHDRRRLSPLHRRMLDRVVRDVDIVSAVSRRSEAAINPDTGRTVGDVHVIDANTPYVGDLLNEASRDDVFVLNGDVGEIVLPKSFQLKSGQSVLGGGTSLAVRGATSHKQANWEVQGSRPTIDFDGMSDVVWRASDPTPEGTSADYRPDPVGFDLADDTAVRGIDITGGAPSIRAEDVSNVTIHDVNLRESERAGIEVRRSTDVSISNVSIEDTAPWNPEIVAVYDITQFFATGQNVPEAGSTPTGGTFNLDFGESGNSHGWYFMVDPDDVPSATGLFVYDSSNVHVENVGIRNVTEGMRIVESDEIWVKHLQIEDTIRDGIRIIDSSDVTLSEIELIDIAKRQNDSPFALPGMNGPLAAVHLQDTERITVRDAQLRSIHGYAVFAESATSTILERLTIRNVRDGIFFEGGSDIHISAADIQLGVTPPGSGNGSPVTDSDDVDEAILLFDMAGNVIVRDSKIFAGPNGAYVWFQSDNSSSTNLEFLDNQLQSSSDSGLYVRTGSDHKLIANLEGNEIAGFQVGLYDSSSEANHIRFKENSLDRSFQAESEQESRLTLSVVDNVLGGDRMGQIGAYHNESLTLHYLNNTSAAGAEPMRIRNSGGSVAARIEGNDHEPVTDGPIDELDD